MIQSEESKATYKPLLWLSFGSQNFDKKNWGEIEFLYVITSL